MSTLTDAASSFLGGPSRVCLCFAGMAAGGAALLVGLAIGRAEATFGALCASWLFFAGLAAGGLALSAAMRLAQAEWADEILPVAEATSAFLAPAAGILVVLLAAARFWMPELAAEGGHAWISLSARVLASMVLLLWAARRYLASARSARKLGDAVVYVVVYVFTLTLWAIDLVMGLREWAPSTVIPLFYLMGALLSAVAWTMLVTSVRALAPIASRADLAKILFGLSIFWFYLLFSGFLPVWYANLPDETGQLLARWEGGFKPVSIAVVASVFFLPFAVLMPGAAKRNPARVGFAAALILAGLVAERFLLVLPSLDAHGPWAAIAALGTTAGLLGAFLLTAGAELAKTSTARA
jgi:Ni/Fe-hydrogenase subunit HybB-like protein